MEEIDKWSKGKDDKLQPLLDRDLPRMLAVLAVSLEGKAILVSPFMKDISYVMITSYTLGMVRQEEISNLEKLAGS